MAQVASRGPSAARGADRDGITKEQAYELEQYEKIIRLRDAVLAGTHPTIKVAPDFLARVEENTANGASLLDGPQDRKAGANLITGQGEVHAQNSAAAEGPSAKQPPSPKHSTPEVNPSFLEKSEHLVRAELKLQRQRAEKALRDEVEQRRPAKNASSALMTDIDIPDVLSKALAIVPAIPAAVPAVPDASANSDNRSDSFDDNTFYSSRHDTPDLRSSPSRRNAAEAAEPLRATAGDSDEAIEDIYDPPSPRIHPVAARPLPEHLPQTVTAQSDMSQPISTVPGLNNYLVQSQNSSWSGTQERTENSCLPGLGNIQQAKTAYRDVSSKRDQVLATEAYAEAHPPSPLLRTHDLQPVAPQPAHYAVMPIDSSASNSGAPTATGTPAQVAALRNDPASATSPDSSPQGGRVPERKRSKKKKRKADRQAAEFETVTVKPEPRSPSPMAAPSYIRPSKRARHAHRQAQGQISAYTPTHGHTQGYGSPDDDVSTSGRTAGAPLPLPLQGEPVPKPQVRSGQYPPRPASSTLHGTRRYSGGYVDSRGRVTHHPSYGAYPPPPYGFQEPPEIIYDYMDGSEGYPRAIPQQVTYEGSRMSHRPEGSAYIGPSRSQPQKVYIDSTGREYLEPRRPLVRQSVAPAGYYREPDVIYERAAPRAVSRYAEPTHYVEAGTPYGSVTQGYPTSRRVVTQPEYVQQQPYGEAYPNEYLRRSMMPPDVRTAEAAPGQDFVTRAASVRPPPPPPPPAAPLSGEYAPSQDYGISPDSRMESVVRGYERGAAAVGRQTPAQAYAWEYETGPGGHAASGPGYYAAPNRGTEEIAFIGQPPGPTQDIVYADRGRERTYR